MWVELNQDRSSVNTLLRCEGPQPPMLGHSRRIDTPPRSRHVRFASNLVMMIGGAQVYFDQIAESFVLRNLDSPPASGRRVSVRALRDPEYRTRDDAGARN